MAKEAKQPGIYKYLNVKQFRSQKVVYLKFQVHLSINIANIL